MGVLKQQGYLPYLGPVYAGVGLIGNIYPYLFPVGCNIRHLEELLIPAIIRELDIELGGVSGGRVSFYPEAEALVTGQVDKDKRRVSP